MKVLLTGATGLLGSHVAAQLLKNNYQVRVFIRPDSNTAALEGLKLEYFRGQLTIQEDICNAVRGCSFVIHSAALAVHMPTALEAFREINVEGTRLIIEACKKEGISRLVYISTANCFKNGTLTNPGNEKGIFPRWMKKSGYAYSKYLAQQMVLEETANGNMDAVVVNPTFIVGKDKKPGAGKIFTYILNKKVAFHPMGGKNFVDAGATARGVVLALEKGRSGECYILAGENLSYRQFFKIVMNLTRQNSILIPVPCFMLKVAGLMGDVSEKYFNRPVELTLVNARMLCLGNYYSPAKAVKELDFPIVSARESIKNTLRWYRKQSKN